MEQREGLTAVGRSQGQHKNRMEPCDARHGGRRQQVTRWSRGEGHSRQRVQGAQRPSGGEQMSLRVRRETVGQPQTRRGCKTSRDWSRPQSLEEEAGLSSEANGKPGSQT